MPSYKEDIGWIRRTFSCRYSGSRAEIPADPAHVNSRNVEVAHGNGLAWRFLSGRAAQVKNVRDEKLDALVAELQTIELWNAREKSAHEDEIEARRRRRLEIIREIDARTSKSK